jgi:hypothetical protein
MRTRVITDFGRKWHETSPSKAISASGSGNDIVARLIGQWLSERLGQTFIIENRALLRTSPRRRS